MAPENLPLPKAFNGSFWSKNGSECIRIDVLGYDKSNGDDGNFLKFDPPRTIFSKK